MAKKERHRRLAPVTFSSLAPQVGLEPTTLRLTAECSAIELLRKSTTLRISTRKTRAGFIANGQMSVNRRRLFDGRHMLDPDANQKPCHEKTIELHLMKRCYGVG